MINWVYFPKSSPPTEFGLSIVSVFEGLADSIDSTKSLNQHSDTVMARLRPGLEKIGFRVEKGKRTDDKIVVPVLFGRKRKILKAALQVEVQHFVEKMLHGQIISTAES